MKNLNLKAVFVTLQIVPEWNQVEPQTEDLFWTIECSIGPMFTSVEEKILCDSQQPKG